MTILEAIILGSVQGLTEFLPVSSSGHLVIFQQLLGFTSPQIFFDIMIHLATLVAVLIFFKDKLLNLDKKTIKNFILASIPAGIAGLLVQPYLDLIFSSLWVVIIGLFITSFFLSRLKDINESTLKLTHLTGKKALIPGIFQVIAIFPGVSRSGSTLFGGIIAGLKREDAFFFSFLLAIPTILGAAVLEINDIKSLISIDWIPVIIGMATAFLTGLVALKLLRKLIVETKLHYFSYYCATIATVLTASLVIEAFLG